MNLTESHLLAKLDKRVKRTNPCTVSTNYGDVTVEQTTSTIYTATWQGFIMASDSASSAFLRLIPTIKNQQLVSIENY